MRYTMIGRNASVDHLGDEALATLYKQMRLNQGNQQRIAIVDIDNTLRCHKHRDHLLPSEEAARLCKVPNLAYHTFNEACWDDSPIKGAVDFVSALGRTHRIILLSCCTASDNTVEATFKQMVGWGVPFEAIFLRGADNQLSNPVMKEDFMVSSGLSLYAENMVSVDDSHDNAKMFADLGIVSLQIINK